MRKRVFGKQLSRNRNSRKALFRSLVRAMVLEGSVVTTLAKAKALKPELERIMGIVAKDSLVARKRVIARLGNDKETAEKLFGQYLELAKGRQSGFIRVIAMPLRAGDNAKMARIEWVEVPVKPEAAKDKKEKK